MRAIHRHGPIIATAILALGLGCNQNQTAQNEKKKSAVESKDHKFTNRLAKEKSPYLQQHAHNPVEIGRAHV